MLLHSEAPRPEQTDGVSNVKFDRGDTRKAFVLDIELDGKEIHFDLVVLHNQQAAAAEESQLAATVFHIAGPVYECSFDRGLQSVAPKRKIEHYGEEHPPGMEQGMEIQVDPHDAEYQFITYFAFQLLRNIGAMDASDVQWLGARPEDVPRLNVIFQSTSKQVSDYLKKSRSQQG